MQRFTLEDCKPLCCRTLHTACLKCSGAGLKTSVNVAQSYPACISKCKCVMLFMNTNGAIHECTAADHTCSLLHVNHMITDLLIDLTQIPGLCGCDILMHWKCGN